MSAPKHLFEPLRIATMTAPNRLMMSAMSINFGVDGAGCVTEQLTGYLRARAAGGAGMMLVGGGAVHPSGLELPQLPTLWDDGCISSLQKMVAAIKPYGTCFGMQLMHGGRQSYHDRKVAPSPIKAPAVVKSAPRELAPEEIHELVQSFGDAARRCREAGFDFIEIHGAHGYLINQFLAPNSNHREDRYGGSFENRIRFLLELLADIKQKTGNDFPVGIRINGQDYIPNGWTLADTLQLAPLLEHAGAAYLHVSAGVYGSTQLTIPPMYVPQGCFVPLAAAVKKVVTIPVVAVGRIKSPQFAETIVTTGQADVVAMGRTFLADPYFVSKAAAGKYDQIRPCIGCCLGCIHQVLALEPGGCVVNPDVGREYLLAQEDRAARSKHILVLGAGPAGLAAARMAARHGHRVTVWEEKAVVGGLARLAALPPGRSEIQQIVTYFHNEVLRLQVKLKCGVALTKEILAGLNPDEIVVATGSLPQMPVIKGVFRTRMQLCTVVEVLEEEQVVGHRVLILGGGQAGLVLADYLAERDKTVVVLNRRRHFAEEMASNDRFYLRERLKRANVTLYKQVAIVAFTDHGVGFHSAGRKERLDKFDTLVLAEKMTSIRAVLESVRTAPVPVHVIGDAKKPRILMHAIAEAEEIGRSL